MQKTNVLLVLALFSGLAFHGSAMFFTLESTYDALIHLFFADHYATDWFQSWDYRWYTGFSVHGYPPLVHQVMGLLSLAGGLKFGMFTVALTGVLLFITGVYRFTYLLTSDERIAGYGALAAVFSSSFVETLHLFGQLPSIIGLSVLLHALPEVYLWIREGSYRKLWRALALIAVTVTSHHVTPIFGMVFFIFPVIGLALMDKTRERVIHHKAITFRAFFTSFKRVFWRIFSFGLSSLLLIITCILPYWINSRQNPITQVPIPHGSRDNFLEVSSSGLVFFLIPWGILLLILPYIFYRFFSKRLLFFGLSFSIMALLGTGGTTPLPRMLLGDTAFNILTLDRFTLWASILALPILAEFLFRFLEGDFREWLKTRFGSLYPKILGGGFLAGILLMVIFSMSLGYFRPSQPQKIEMLPIVNFLNQDEHDRWRYLPLGFGDQMAWLSAQTNALTVDGNYHSARRLPELTTRAVERLENSKFRGVEGIGSLQQFLTIPEKYHLKYVFSNDKFYDPLLYFCGWQRLQQLENGIMVWEKLNIAPLPPVLPGEATAPWLNLMWGLLPVSTLIIAFILMVQLPWWRAIYRDDGKQGKKLGYPPQLQHFSSTVAYLTKGWGFLMLTLLVGLLVSFWNGEQHQQSPETLLTAYYDALDFKDFERAYSYLDPEEGKSLAQYMLEVSVSDGILSSYAKLDRVGIEVLFMDSQNAKAKVRASWITPLEQVDKEFEHRLVKRKDRWYLVPQEKTRKIPAEQFYVSNEPRFYNHGRRKVTTQATRDEDILDQPRLQVTQARMVVYNGQLAIVGEVRNIDNIPADVTLTATIYDAENSEIASYNGMYHLKHKLLPKESTSFKILFEETAWNNNEDQKPGTYDPALQFPLQLRSLPTRFNLQCAGNISTSDLYKSIGLQTLDIQNGLVNGTLYNSGIQEVTIPQLLVSYYDEEGKLLWVDHQFLEDAIRVQRTGEFSYPLLDINQYTILDQRMDLCFVNGLPNPASGFTGTGDITELQYHQGAGFEYIKFDLNGYVGNPK
ncbi:MFS transporter [Zeaxanthinibacter enoshimensis]|uniref:Uncharacterized protein n=1 Tax=Zeaxanthinibacter enoshimensis TaxID=392009 RepID=A0A4R6TP03_9FLAO|nr:hypothetical protein [Zeaxanthinibacter enoshimensis]TDQ31081.1 hypothetical protein CLV82_1782 [Zeaxanthinibacter enoshimensis]